MSGQRIQKVLSRAGIASRRKAEELVLAGRVTVNGERVRDLPVFVDEGDDVRVDGRRVPGPPKRKTYVLLNKPRGVVCTQSDPRGRTRAVDLVPEIDRRIYCVGRLDADSTGLLVLTDDGGLTQHLTHPSHEVPKTYVVRVDDRLSEGEIETLKAKTFLDGKPTHGAAVKVLRSSPKETLLEITLREGRNREIRRILARLGHKVRRLHRRAIGPIDDRGVKIGRYRMLRKHEVAKLRASGKDA